MSTDTGGGVWGRMAGRFRRGRQQPRIAGVDDVDLVVVVRSDDDTAATSSVLDAAGFASEVPVVLRHLIAVPESAAGSAAGSAARDGYVETASLDADPDVDPALVPVSLSRIQRVDARTVSQERSRIASLASRSGGVSVGWAVLDVPRDR
ncbi:hypothetical protein L5I01_16685 [Gordonia sp. HY442]|uniref:hypothetical protein n=1 Tax=Gordonia zhenghanii TaxID=2911516 RepID=UPI001F254923|nr:hypothetical protein [Gordonia zhenghanii]MCF8604993.1 hypothetical protein [Gordonia zhenghanii]